MTLPRTASLPRVTLAGLLGVWAVDCTVTTLAPGTVCHTDLDCSRGDLQCQDGLCLARSVPGRCPPASGDPVTPAGPVRVFSLGLSPTPADAVSYATWAGLIQRAVTRDVAPHVATDRPSLLVFPQGLQWLAATVGDRGTVARAQTPRAAAWRALATAYDPGVRYYTTRAGGTLAPARALSLALTDTLWRTLETAYLPVAQGLHVWVAVPCAVAEADRVTDPAMVALLADPQATDRSHVWVAHGDTVYDQTLVFSPEGTLVAALKRETLDPTEVTDLGLSYPSPGTARGVDLPFGRVGSALATDAASPDVLDRLAVDGVRLLLFPQASPGWAGTSPEGAWWPDVMKSTVWSSVVRSPDVRAGALACLSANAWGTGYDGQGAVLVPGGVGTPRGGFIGEDTDMGFARVAPWYLPDDPTQSLATRQGVLAARGTALGPGGTMAGQYTPASVYLDVDLGAPTPVVTGAAPDGTAVSAELAPVAEGSQGRPDVVALSTGSLVAAWEDTREGCGRITMAVSLARQLSFTQAMPRTGNLGAPRSPRVAAHGASNVVMAWQEAVPGITPRDDDVYVARSLNGGQSFLAPVRMADTVARGTRQASPAVAVDTVDGTVHVAWMDARNGPARVYTAHSVDGGASFVPELPLEPAPGGAYDPGENAWGPAVAASGGRVVVAWSDRRDGAWGIHGAESADGGRTWSPPIRVDDAGNTPGRRAWEPAVWLDPAGGWGVAWTDQRGAGSDTDVRVARVDHGAPGASMVLPRTDTTHRPQWAPAVAVAPNGTVVVLWQDLRADANHVYMATSTDGGRHFTNDRRVDDGPGQSQQYAPRATVRPDGTVVAVWDDDRSGHHRVRTAVVTLPQE